MSSAKLALALGLAVLTIVTTRAPADTASVELRMIHSMRESLTRGSESIGVFTPDGPRLATLRPAPSRVDFITYDPATGTYYGQQVGTIGTIGDDGDLTEVDRPASVNLSHAGGLAFDEEQRCVLVASRSGAGTVLHRYFPDTGAWNAVGNLGRDEFRGLACHGAEGLIFVLDQPHHVRGCANLRVFNATGAQVASVPLSAPIPFYSELGGRVQLTFAEGAVYALSSHYAHPRVANTLYRIDPVNGEVQREPHNAAVDLNSKTWPGWREGPPPSKPQSGGGAQGTGFYSNYRTPERFVKNAPGELHVIVVGSGAVDHLEWLKKVKSVRASTGGGKVAVEVQIDPTAEMQHPVVEVEVGRTRRPVTLALISGSTVLWSIDTAPDANVERVITFNAPHFTKSTVIGVDAARVVDGGAAAAVHAWEMEQASCATRFHEMIELIRGATGLRESTYQGMYRGTGFRVP